MYVHGAETIFITQINSTTQQIYKACMKQRQYRQGIYKEQE